MSPSWKPTSSDIVAALREVYLPSGAITSGQDEWSLLTEVCSTGSPVHEDNPMPATRSPMSPDYDDQAWVDWRERGKIRAIDVLLVHNWRSGKVPYERIAVEVKISRADFRRDTPAKRAPWEALVHRFAYAVPAGLVTVDEVPSGCWLIEVSEHSCDGTSTGHKHTPTRVHWNRKVKGAWLTPAPFPDALVAALAREGSRAKEAIRAADVDSAGDGAVGAKVADDLRRAKNRVMALEEREAANRERYGHLLDLVAPLLPQDCSHCGAPIKPVVPATYGSGSWDHVKETDRLTCTPNWDSDFRWRGIEPASVRDERTRASTEAQRAQSDRRTYLMGLDPADDGPVQP